MPNKCNECGKTLKTKKGLIAHNRDKHTEPSMAELFIEAELNDAMGEPVDDWLRDMMQ